MTTEQTDTLVAAWKARSEGRLNEARTMLEGLLAAAGRDASAKLRVVALVRLAHVSDDEGDASSAATLADRALELACVSGDPMVEAYALRHAADFGLAAGSRADAVELYRRSLALYRDSVEARNLDRANVAARLARLADPVEAAELWREARAGYAVMGIAKGVQQAEVALAALEG